MRQSDLSKPYKIGIYLRTANVGQVNASVTYLKFQEQYLRDYVEQNNFQAPWGEVIEVFSDLGASGVDTNRAGYQKMLSKIENGEINFVLSSGVSRISRSIGDLSKFLNFIKKHNCRFECITKPHSGQNHGGSHASK